MNYKLLTVVLVALAFLVLWKAQAQEKPQDSKEISATVTGLKPSEVNVKTEQATFAAGCFWGVETTFRKVPGVISTQVGYTGGKMLNPTYRDVCTDTTGHAEAVLVTYDPSKVSYAELLDTFWSLHDPTTLNSQGPDFGTQYRSAIFTHNDEQAATAKASLKEVSDAKVFKRRIVTEIVPAEKFYTAEEYHQQYFEKKGVAAECHVGVAEVHTNLAKAAAEARKSASSYLTTKPTTSASCSPDDPNSTCGIEHWKSMTEAELKAKLTPEQYEIARNAGTERAFTGKYWNEHRDGMYRCAVCGQELFDSKTKFESGTGWPSFYQPVKPGAVTEKTDRAYGMVRTEVVCSQCQSHLGHVFDDGPNPTGKRYCMNSAVLDLKVREKK